MSKCKHMIAAEMQFEHWDYGNT